MLEGLGWREVIFNLNPVSKAQEPLVVLVQGSGDKSEPETETWLRAACGGEP